MASKSSEDERRRVFRRMAWYYVYLPPVLAVLIAALGAALVAWLAPVEGTSFWGRWSVIVLIVLGIPTAWQLYKRRSGKQE
ncbi:MAG TPA: hypothetical protein VFI91_13095 [Longimicrobiaceae bacterium]|nr:hypothetical protein [Longimicrobiaceae bacterium]